MQLRRARSLPIVFSLALLGLAAIRSNSPAQAGGSPIEHIIIMYQENHAFDEVLGALCVADARCDGATSGKTHDGQVIPLQRGKDIVPSMGHNHTTQQLVIRGGKMNGWDLMGRCNADTGYACYQSYQPDQIPNLADLARSFVISDRTFQMDIIPTWGAHVALVAAQLDGFLGDNPIRAQGVEGGPGWGCDSNHDALWRASASDLYTYQPSCIPAPDGSGPYRPTPVQWVPTIMDRMDAAGLSWKMYATQPQEGGGYTYATCPSFASCFYGPQRANYVAQEQFFIDSAAGNLPNLSLVIPNHDNSQHNQASMLTGDNWIGAVVSAAMSAPTWDSTAIFITYDDCGCFYDHVPPPPGLGIRSPMVIVSPFAKPGYTDSNIASYASMLSFTEHTFGLPPLWTTDAQAYDYSESFNYTQEPLPPIELHQNPIPPWVTRWLKAHPPRPDPT